MLPIKAKRYFKESGERFSNITIKFQVNAFVLTLAVHDLLSPVTKEGVYDHDHFEYTNSDAKVVPITTKIVEEEIRLQLRWKGEGWFDEMEKDWGTDEDQDKSNQWKAAEKIAYKLFQNYFISHHDNSLRFILED